MLGCSCRETSCWAKPTSTLSHTHRKSGLKAARPAAIQRKSEASFTGAASQQMTHAVRFTTFPNVIHQTLQQMRRMLSFATSDASATLSPCAWTSQVFRKTPIEFQARA
jgi:hypothetical protein